VTHPEKMERLTLKDLKARAEHIGLKRPGVGWPTCCPPSGNKADILAALQRIDVEAPCVDVHGPVADAAADAQAPAADAPPPSAARASGILDRLMQAPTRFWRPDPPAVGAARVSGAAAASSAASAGGRSGGARFVVFDFETTGLGKTANIRIVQVGARALDSSLCTVSTFSSLVNPTVKIQKGAVAVHGISDERVRREKTWAVVGAELNQWLERIRAVAPPDQSQPPLTLLAHNGKRYDVRILLFENSRHGHPLPANVRHADTIDVFKRSFPGRDSYNLGQMHADILGHELENAHDAMADVDGVCALLRKVACRDGREGELGVIAEIDVSSESLGGIAQRCGL
jgi:DNA polymerase III epsilon subunit-like protein